MALLEGQAEAKNPKIEDIHNDLFYAGVAQLVERNLAKVDVAGSNPVSRSI